MTSFHGNDGARPPCADEHARLTDDAVYGLARRFPELSAQTVVTRGQAAGLALAAMGFFAALFLRPRATMFLFAAAMSAVFLASVLFRAFLAWFGARPRVAETIAQGDDLPDYTILVPLYREAAVVPGLVKALAGLDYPRAHLQVLLVVEADDAETVAAAERHAAPPFEIVRVPPSLPRTKPNSCVAFFSAFAKADCLDFWLRAGPGPWGSMVGT